MKGAIPMLKTTRPKGLHPKTADCHQPQNEFRDSQVTEQKGDVLQHGLSQRIHHLPYHRRRFASRNAFQDYDNSNSKPDYPPLCGQEHERVRQHSHEVLRDFRR